MWVSSHYRTHFTLSYVLRYAGLLDEAARECDSARALDRNNYQIRSCSGVFIQQGEPRRAMEFVRLDAGSEYAAMQTAVVLLDQGKLAEARQALQKASESPLTGRDLLQACLDSPQSSQCDDAAHKIEAAALAGVDVEPSVFRRSFAGVLCSKGCRSSLAQKRH